MPLLLVTHNTVKRYEYIDGDYECVEVIAKRISYDKLLQMRIEILDKYNKQLEQKENKNDDKSI